MKRSIVGLLSFLTFSTAVAPVVQAETLEVTPFQLVSLAQEGYFENQGIPKGSTLLDEYQAGRITANDMIQTAVKDKRLTENTLGDRDYLNALTEQLRIQTENDYNRTGGHR